VILRVMGVVMISAAWAVRADLPAKSQAAASPSVEEIALTVRGAPAPTPAMRYHLLPEIVDQAPGNAAMLYLTAAQQVAGARASDPAASDDERKIDKWLATPVDELPRDEVRAVLGRYEAGMRQLRIAALRDRCDFSLSFRTDGFRTVLPGMADARVLARLAVLSGRSKLAEGDFAGAVNELGIPLVQARHLNEQAFLVQLLVAASVGELALRQIPDVIGRQNSPNLYWALGDLPSPFLDVRGAMKMERAGAYFTVPQLKEARGGGRLTAEQWREAVRAMTDLRLHSYGAQANRAPEEVMLALYCVKEYPVAKQYLLERKVSAKEIDAMSASQVLGLYHVGQFERWTQEMDKCLTLPYWQGIGVLNRTEAQMRGAMSASPWSLLGVFAPNIKQPYTNVARIDRQIALWRCVEAVRAYAAGHDGNAPARLEEVVETPAPLDPMTGKAFVYEANGGRVRIEGPTVEAALPLRTGMRVVLTISRESNRR
jgi:hypothetical protein